MSVAFRAMLAVGLILFPSVPLYAQTEGLTVDDLVKSELTTTDIVDSVDIVHYNQVISLTPGYNLQSPLPVYGKAMYYNPGVMETVLENRLKSNVVGHCFECVGYVAMLRAGDLNRRVWIQLTDSTVEGPFHVIDAADQKHVYMLQDKSWVVDVDYETAMRWKMAGPIHVTLWDEPPSKYQLASGTTTHEDHIVDIYRHEKLDYFNKSYEYSGHVDTLYVD